MLNNPALSSYKLKILTLILNHKIRKLNFITKNFIKKSLSSKIYHQKRYKAINLKQFQKTLVSTN
jgi:hypothetical protein